ncbi:MAG: anthranilate phosphoribosyltransferase [Cellulomonas sp.]|nr:anthranilate phosphoribosyltransferase [Cellulomonas sp.]
MSTGPGAAVELTWPDLFAALVARRDLAASETAWAMDQIMSGEVSTARIAAFLIALRAKGETVDELTGLADQMLAHARRFTVPGRTVDIVGTGGDRAHTVNVSTMASFVMAGAGLTVVKHGNRAASSSSGSADVLEKLGVSLTQSPERVAELASQIGITFCFAQVFHPSMRHAGAARGELGIGTTFNFLGPLTNPAQPQAAAIGVADARMAPLVAGVLAGRGISALVFRGESDGLDELAATGPSRVWEVRGGVVDEQVVDWSAALGLPPITVEQLRGGDAVANARVARDVLAGVDGPVRQTVLLNAAAGLVADGTLPGTASGPLVARMAAGLQLAATAVDSGAAADVLERWRVASPA